MKVAGLIFHTRRGLSIGLLPVLTIAILGFVEAAELEVVPRPLPAEWPNNGSADCQDHRNQEPSIFVFRYDDDTWILRENKCLNFEANFLYLLFGTEKVLLQDTGSMPREYASEPNAEEVFTELFPLREVVEEIIAEWLVDHPSSNGSPRGRDTLELLVTHSHSHRDHVQGDYQFLAADGAPFSSTRVAGLSPEEVAEFFGISEWPNTPSSLDLGGRRLDVLPIPGHEPSSIAIYDHGTRILFTGDSLYPGHIFVRDWQDYRDSIRRLSSWMQETDRNGDLIRPITYVLGTHIEKAPAPGEFYPYQTWIHDPERKLEFFAEDLWFLAEQIEALGPETPTEDIPYPEFILEP